VTARARVALAALPAAFLAVFFVWPVVTIVATGLRPGGETDLGAVRDVLGDPVLRQVAWFTSWQAVASTVVTLGLGLPGAYLFARIRFPGKGVLWAALVIPFVLPTLVVGTAFLQVLGPSGPLPVDLRSSVWAILIAHAFFNYAVVVRTVGGFWAHLDPTLVDAARMLGASRAQAFRKVTLPLLAPSIAAASVIVFIFTFTSFGVVLVLGGPSLHTLEVEIYTQTFSFLNLDVAAVLAIVQLTGVVAALVAYDRVQERRSRTLRLVSATSTQRRPSGAFDRFVIVGNLAIIGVLLVVPLGVLVVRSFSTASGWALTYYQALADAGRGTNAFVPPIEAIRNSVLFALAATVLAVTLGALASFALAGRPRAGAPPRRSRSVRWFDTALMIPLGTSAVTIGFGFLITLDQPPLNLRSSAWLVPIAQALVALPLVVRSILPALRSIDPRLREAASVLGASPFQVWRAVDLPIAGRAIAVGAGFAFAVSMGEFGATVFLARPDLPTVPVAIGRLLGQPGALNMGRAMALSTILMVITAGAMVLIERLRVRGVGEF
jgi:thiamine transport system permease protein